MSDINHNVCPVIDFSNSRIRVVIGQNINNQIALLANVSIKNSGIKEGRIVDMPTVVKAIKAGIQEAEKESGYQIHSVNASIDTILTEYKILQEQIAIPSGEVKEQNVAYLISSIKNRVNQANGDIIHFLPQFFCINQNWQNLIKDPVGLLANQLLASVYCVSTKQKSYLANIKRAVRQAGVNLNFLISSGYAAAYAASTPQERQNQIFVLDIGEETTSFFCFQKGFPSFSGGFNCGGKNITNYIANRLQISPELAEKLKREHADISTEAKDYLIDTESVVRPVIKNLELAEYTRQAYKALFSKLNDAIVELGVRFSNNIILTGGGSMVKGFSEFLQFHYNTQSRIEYYDPTNNGEDLGLITAYGMLKLRFSEDVRDFKKSRTQPTWKRKFKKLGANIKNWLEV